MRRVFHLYRPGPSPTGSDRLTHCLSNDHFYGRSDNTDMVNHKRDHGFNCWHRVGSFQWFAIGCA